MILKAHAKINLYLDVLSQLPKGYHNIQSVMQSLELADILSLSVCSSGIEVVCGLSIPPQDNLAYKAAAIFKKETGATEGVVIKIEKNIPVAAGLGGGSADAAAVLTGLNILWNINLPLEDLQKIAAKIGADVPFCLVGGTMLAEGIGDILKPLPPTPPVYIVVAKSSFGLSTAQVYKELDKEKPTPLKKLDAVCASLEKGDLFEISQHLNNILESVVLKSHPEIKELKEIALANGASGALMSGSGPSVFALAEKRGVAESILKALRPRSDFAILTRCSNNGVEVKEIRQ